MKRRFLLTCLVLCSIGVSSFGNASSASDVVVFSCENFEFIQSSGTLTVKATVEIAELADGTFVARAHLNDRTITSKNVSVRTSAINSENVGFFTNLERSNPGVNVATIASMTSFGDSSTGMISNEIPLSFTVFKDADGEIVAKVVAPQGGSLVGRCGL